MTEASSPRRTARPVVTVRPEPPVERAEAKPPDEKVDRPKSPPPPFLLDFFPLEESKYTQLDRFFAGLKERRFLTTRCPRDKTLHWPPRVVCPTCHARDLEWVDLPKAGRVYAFSAVLAGAPLGMEDDVPFVVGLVDLDGEKLRLFGRVVGVAWERCRIGLPVHVEPFELPDGRWFYRFRAAESAR